jgi:hypothetical protein
MTTAPTLCNTQSLRKLGIEQGDFKDIAVIEILIPYVAILNGDKGSFKDGNLVLRSSFP